MCFVFLMLSCKHVRGFLRYITRHALLCTILNFICVLILCGLMIETYNPIFSFLFLSFHLSVSHSFAWKLNRSQCFSENFDLHANNKFKVDQQNYFMNNVTLNAMIQ